MSRRLIRRRRRGNAIIEAALVVPILLLLAFGTVEFGHFFYIKHSLQGAAREGARAAIIATASGEDVGASVAEVMTTAGLGNSGYTLTLTPADLSTAAEGTHIRVRVQCNWGAVGVRPLGLIDGGKTLSATVTMRREG